MHRLEKMCYMSLLIVTFSQKYVEAMCQRNRDCVTFQAPFSNRRYCCNRRFCCTWDQYRNRTRSDPVVALSIGAIIAIVFGVILFFVIVAVVVARFCKKKSRTTLPGNTETPSSPHTVTRNGQHESFERNMPEYDSADYETNTRKLPSAPWYAPPPSRERTDRNTYETAPPPYNYNT
ncbi:uncharacterized protein LOC120333841 [Styela clava]